MHSEDLGDNGIYDPMYMVKAVLWNAHPMRTKQAVIELVEEFEGRQEMPFDEVLDRLVQVSAFGCYHPGGGIHEDDHEEAVEQFRKQLDDLPEDDEMNLTHDEWMRKMGIPLEEEGNDDIEEDQ